MSERDLARSVVSILGFLKSKFEQRPLRCSWYHYLFCLTSQCDEGWGQKEKCLPIRSHWLGTSIVELDSQLYEFNFLSLTFSQYNYSGLMYIKNKTADLLPTLAPPPENSLSQVVSSLLIHCLKQRLSVLAEHCNHLESFKNSWSLVPSPRDSNFTVFECSLGIWLINKLPR